MFQNGVDSIELVFTRGPSVSRRAKTEALWIFLDGQSDLKPHLPPPKTTNIVKSLESIGNSKESVSDEKTSEDCFPCLWYEGICTLRHFEPDKLAQTAKDGGDELRRCRNLRMQEDMADTVEESYENLNSELKAYEQRVEKNYADNCKRQIYEVPEKYKRFLRCVI